MTLLIKKERQRRKWTLTYVAERTSTTKSMVQMLETGQRKPSYEVLIKLEDLFGMSHRELFKTADVPKLFGDREGTSELSKVDEKNHLNI